MSLMQKYLHKRLTEVGKEMTAAFQASLWVLESRCAWIFRHSDASSSLGVARCRWLGVKNSEFTSLGSVTALTVLDPPAPDTSIRLLQHGPRADINVRNRTDIGILTVHDNTGVSM